LISPNQEGKPVFVIRALDDIEEAEFIAATIQSLVQNYQCQYKDFAVLYSDECSIASFGRSFFKASHPLSNFCRS